ncbi:hypothetical protein [Demequina litorisediminis]|uniref:Uncharacterized protein n=1 Tax=Demequina litorisediminis TaxID=1849022 RepID=A0ABQ6IDA4_9MICO|nr:hypothetical protein [Demequina litorisediminis]GMA35832.1 hypothetical protein GCM10025876_20360 [Demequina litorisediminis]
MTLWQWLALGPLEQSGDFYESTATVAGKYYGKVVKDSVYDGGSDFSSEYNLSFKCVTVKSAMGLDDSSDSGMNVIYSADLDGSRAFTSSAFGVGKSTTMSLNTTGVFRIGSGPMSQQCRTSTSPGTRCSPTLWRSARACPLHRRYASAGHGRHFRPDCGTHVPPGTW